MYILRKRRNKKVEELVEKAKNKDNEAFDKLILMMEKEMYLISKARLHSEDDIADAMQETILKAYKHIHKLRDNSLFKTWIIRILINECNTIYKKRNTISLDDNNMEIKDENNNNDKLSFYILIKNLTEEERTILTLYYYSKYTTKEISNILKIKENTIKSKIIRAKNKLRNEHGGEKNG